MFRFFWPLLLLDDGDAAGGGLAVAAPAPAAPAAPVVAPAAEPAEPARGTGAQQIARTIADLKSQISADGMSIVDPNAPPVPPVVPPADPTAPPAEAVVADPAAAPADTPTVATIALPGRRQGEEPVEITIDDPAIAERLRGVMNDGMRADEVKRQLGSVERQRDELNFIEDRIKVDPVGFLLDTVPAEVRREVALAMLAEDGELEAVKEILDRWAENTDARKIARLEAANTRRGQVATAQQRAAQAREGRAAVQYVTNTADAIASLVKPEMQARFVDDFLRDVQESVRGNQLNGPLTHERLVSTFEYRLGLYGITPQQALAAIKSPGVRELPMAKPSGEAAERIAATVTAARSQGGQFLKTAAVRRTAAIVPSPGAGGSPPVEALPKENVKDRIATVRKLFGSR